VGLPDAAVRESRERVRSAPKTAATIFRRRIPPLICSVDLRKVCSGFDLPMALATLGAYGGQRTSQGALFFFGEFPA